MKYIALLIKIGILYDALNLLWGHHSDIALEETTHWYYYNNSNS